MDFTQSNYRWNDMRDVYKKGAFSDEEATAVATLMRDCGFAADMSYAADVSGTPINAAYAGLKANFKYPSTMQLLYRMDYIAKDAEWMDLIFKEISERRAISMEQATRTLITVATPLFSVVTMKKVKFM